MQSPDFKHMLGRLLGPAKAEIGCDECFEQLDRYVDLQVAGHDADAALPGSAQPTCTAAPPAARSTRACAPWSARSPNPPHPAR